MTNADQFADSIIEEEGLDKPAQDNENKGESTQDNQESQDAANDGSENDDVQSEGESTDDGSDVEDTEGESTGEGDDGEGSKSDSDDDEKDESEESDKKEKVEDKRDDTASRVVENSRSLLGELSERGMKITDDQGNIRKFDEVVPPGEYFASALEPVKVTDKDGKTHEFLLISDVEKQFPDGFEAKNNLEQMKFERAIQKNEDTFDKAIEDYKGLEDRYNEEIQQVTASRQSNDAIRQEYTAMANEGLVPKVGDPKDPNFAQSDAVKELNKILEYQKTENARRKEKGLGQLTSLYDTKLAMNNDPKLKEKQEKMKKIDQQRKSVASLSRSPASKGTESKKSKQSPTTNMATFAEQLIAEEGLQ